MGCALALELIANQPPSPGPEWPLLLQLAADADDLTRRTACGYDYMAERTHAPRRTVYRWLQKLHEAGQIVTVEKSAGGTAKREGRRATYEVQVSARQIARIAEHLARDGCHGGAPVSESGNGPQNGQTGATAGGTRLGRRVPQLVAPPIYGPVSEAPVEGAQVRRDPERSEEPRIKIESHSRPERLREGAGRAGRTSTPENLQPDSKAQDRRGVSSPADVDVTRARGAA